MKTPHKQIHRHKVVLVFWTDRPEISHSDIRDIAISQWGERLHCRSQGGWGAAESVYHCGRGIYWGRHECGGGEGCGGVLVGVYFGALAIQGVVFEGELAHLGAAVGVHAHDRQGVRAVVGVYYAVPLAVLGPVGTDRC